MNPNEENMNCADRLPDTEAGLRAGVARSEITIQLSEIGIHDPLWTKALVLNDGAVSVVVIAMDAVSIGGIADVGDDFLPALRLQLEKEFGFSPSHVLVNASHTHPGNRIVCSPEELLDRTVDAVRRALHDMVAVKVGVGCGMEDRISINRALRLRNGKQWTIRQGYPCPPDEQVEGVKQIDPSIGLLRVDRLDGGPIAVVFNYACHSLLGVPSGGITANFSGFAAEVIEENLPGAVAIFLQGAAGDITELLYKDVNRPRDARPLGMMLGLSVLRAWRDIKTSPSARILIFNEPLELPRRTDYKERIDELQRERDELVLSLRFTSLNFKAFLPLYLKHLVDPVHPADYSYRYLQERNQGRDDLRHMDAENCRNIGKYLENIRAMEKLAKLTDDIETLKKHQDDNATHGASPFVTEVIGFKLGDFVLVSSATEVCTEVSLNIKRASPFPHTFIAAFTNGYLHYGAAGSDYGSGSYEVTECILAPEWQRLFETKAGEILKKIASATE